MSDSTDASGNADGADQPAESAPAIVVACSRPDAVALLLQELRRRYGRDYRVLHPDSGHAALRDLEALKRSGGQAAIVLADEQLPDIASPEFFARVRSLFPDAKRGLLVPWGAWGDPDVAEQILQLVALGRIDYYVLQPWRHRDEYFHRTITEFLLEWERAASGSPREVTVVGDPQTRRMRELLSLLARNGIPHGAYPAASDRGRDVLEAAGVSDASGPVVLLRGGRVLVAPSNAELAAAYGIPTTVQDDADFDVVIVGSGPAGLAAAVYAASEGLRTLVVERESIGGQAASSSLIRNYLGFSRGISGAELAQRAYQQAWVFGASFLLMNEVEQMEAADGGYLLTMAGGERVRTQSVVLATGVSYRRLRIPELERLVGAGVFYGASVTEARALAGQDAYVVGGGNSAGQAAMHLSRYARSVTILVRGDSLADSMSSYLISEIDASATISVRYRCEVVGAHGESRLEGLRLRDNRDGSESTVPAGGLFILIGARPRTDWLPQEIARDQWGYVLTGASADDAEGSGSASPRMMHETSLPRVFAVGDVRSRSVKRVASAVGEGSVVISQVHQSIAPDPASPTSG